jgi:hypothetical protein
MEKNIINFDWQYYINRYPDLQKAQINTYEKALKHWKTYGKKEGRVCNNKNIIVKEKKILDKPINLLDYINKYDLIFYKNDSINDRKSNNEIIPRIIAVIPVHGREQLLKYTIRRLYNKNKLYKVICVGSTESEKEVVLQEKGIWVYHENKPLGRKWNTGFKIAQIYNPDAVLFVGSSDWISADWTDIAYKYMIDENIGIVGKNRFDMIDINNNINNNNTCYWLGYPENSDRHKETIGIGRLISKSFLDKINYEPFDNFFDNSMDFCMYKKCINNKFKIKIIENDSIFLSVSCSKWENKHKFNNHYLAAHNIDEFNKLGLSDDLNLTYKRSRMHTPDELTKLYEEFNELNEFISSLV